MRRSARRRSAVLLTVLLPVLLATAVACGGPEPLERVARDRWAGQAMLCQDFDEMDRLAAPFTQTDAGQVDDLGDDPAGALAAGQCRLLGTGTGTAEAAAPAVRPDRRHLAVGTGADRLDVALAGLDADARPPRVTVELRVVGDGCVSTADYRGHLMLLLEAPSDAALPEVELVRVPEGC